MVLHCNVKLFSLYYNFIHFIAFTILILIRFHQLDIIILNKEKSFSSAANIIDIKSIAKAILKRFKKSIYYIDLSCVILTRFLSSLDGRLSSPLL
jgi:hypothetical protein